MSNTARVESPGWRQASSWLTRLTRQNTLLRNGRRYLLDAYAAAGEAQVTPFLMWGTLLGCVRENRFMPHDGDIDLGIRAADYDRRNQWAAAMKRRGYNVPFDYPYKFRFNRPTHSLHVDVDVFYPWGDRAICAFHCDGITAGEAFPSGAFDRLREIQFLGIRVLVPDPPEIVLEAIYGDWRVPRDGYDSSTGPLNRIDFAPGEPPPPLPPA